MSRIRDVDDPRTAAVADLLGAHRFAVLDEHHLQAGIGEILAAAGIKHEREVRLSGRDRVDFLTAAGVGIEVKVAGAAPPVLGQLARYAQSNRVASLLLVTTRSAHVVLPLWVGGVSLRVLLLRGAG